MQTKKPNKPATRPKPAPVPTRPADKDQKRKTAQSSRVLRELLESAEDLSAYGVVSKPDMARMKALCGEPPEYSPERAALEGLEGRPRTG